MDTQDCQNDAGLAFPDAQGRQISVVLPVLGVRDWQKGGSAESAGGRGWLKIARAAGGGAGQRVRSTRAAALIVAAMSASVCAVEMKPASNCDGAR